jgi:hypothetical protein
MNYTITREKNSTSWGLNFSNGDVIYTKAYDGINAAFLFLTNK